MKDIQLEENEHNINHDEEVLGRNDVKTIMRKS